jgi:DNA-binding transcriptional ArsR family regulator
MAQRSGQPEAALPQGTKRVTELDQIRAMADPLRLRILGALVGVPRTTKQVAQLLGEKPTRLYHHVEALERAGLIRLTETRPNRGTVEKYFQAVAAQFQVAASALSPQPGETVPTSEVGSMLDSVLDMARAELLANLRPGASPAESADAPLVARLMIRGTSKEVRAVRRQLLRWIDKLRVAEAQAQGPGAEGAPGEHAYAVTIVMCRADQS